MAKKILIFTISTWVVEFLLLLLVQTFVQNDFCSFYNSHNMVQIEIGTDATIYYLSPEDHMVKIFKTHINDNQELFEQWRRLSGLSEAVIINHMEIQSGYEEVFNFENSEIWQYISINPIVECDLSAEIYLYTQSYFDVLIDTWAQTICGQWESELGGLTISVEGEVVYQK